MRKKNVEYDRFPLVKRGYDPEAVEAHITSAATTNDQTLDEAANRIAALEAELEETRRQEEAVHLTILAATRSKEDILEVARQEGAELAANGRKEGDRIVTDARMQAFQLLTGAREEAETIVGEARAEAAAIARADSNSEPTRPSSSENAGDLQIRVEEMQRVIAAMELELSRRPPLTGLDRTVETLDGADSPPIAIPSAVDSEAIEPIPTEPVTDTTAPPPTASEEDGVDIAVVVDDVPVIEIAAEDTEVSLSEEIEPIPHQRPGSTAVSDSTIGEDTDQEKAATVRRSFYSRRSAKLPRIGSEAGRGAMEAVAALRSNSTTTERTEDGTEPEQTPAFEAV